jgi:glycosyltransferase involved in cell wall biosynthesis
MPNTSLRVHVLGMPHTATNPLFSGCAFTQKVRKLVRLLAEDNPASDARYEVVHYGCERSEVHPSAEHVTVTSWELLERTYGKEWWTRRVPLDSGDAPNQVFRVNATRELRSRVRPNDIVLASWGTGHEPITREIPDAIVVEPGIGYPIKNAFAPYKVFESYAYMNYHYGAKGIASPPWDDAVIPNWFDLSDFDFSADKDDYLLFIGRIQEDKGLRIYVQLAEQLGFKLIVGGHGRLADLGLRPPRNVEEVGFCDVDKRRKLMSRARGYLLFSTYVEPFGGAAVEAMLSGTPVVTSDVGAFPETVLHGVTGYRCRTFDQLVWAVRNLDRIDPQACRSWAEANYSTSRIRLMFDEYLGMLHQRHTDGRGWYARDHERGPLDWLRKSHPENSEQSTVNSRTGHPADSEQSTVNSRTRSQPTVNCSLSTVTAVTALFDIGREGVDGRRFRDYLTWFERTLALRVPMIVHVHPDLERFVQIARGDRPTKIVTRTEPPLFDRIERFDRASAALRGLERRLPSGSWRIEALSPRYLATQWSKFVWLREAAQTAPSLQPPASQDARGPEAGGSSRGPGAGGSFLWIDAGASRFFGNLDLSAPWPHPSWRETLAADRIVVEGHPGMRDVLEGRRRIDATIVGTSEPLIPATCWGGGREAVLRYCDRMLDLLEEMLRSGRVDNEQVGTALLWAREPDLFDVRLRGAKAPADEAGWLEIVRKLAGTADSSDLQADRATAGR